jgi:hypothetical protein
MNYLRECFLFQKRYGISHFLFSSLSKEKLNQGPTYID